MFLFVLTMDKISLFARHSFASCVSKGYAFLAKQLPLISKVMLPYYTVAALCCTLYTLFNIRANVEVATNGFVELSKIFWAMGLWTVTWLTSVVAMARLFLLFRRLTAMEMAGNGDLMQAKKENNKRYTLRRTMNLVVRSLPYTIWGLILNMPGFPILDNFSNKISNLSLTYQGLAVGGLLIMLVVVAIFASPLVYTFYCRMMKPTGLVADDKVMMEQFSFKTAYKKAFHSKCKILSLTIWSAFLCGIACAVLLLPGVVAIEAYLSNAEEVLNFGEHDLIPMSGYVLMAFIGTLAMTFCSMISVAYSATLMYLFGDIYSKEVKKNTNNNSK